MYKDIINYKLAEGFTEKHLLKIAGEIIESWMRNQKGFIKWEIHKNKEENYTDIVYWESEADAKQSEKGMMNIPNAGEWFACYEPGSINSININKIGEFK